jgi:hypothetical protein
MWFLSTHPEVEAKLVDEILGVMGPDSQPSYQQLSEMRYLNAVLKVRGVHVRDAPPVLRQAQGARCDYKARAAAPTTCAGVAARAASRGRAGPLGARWHEPGGIQHIQQGHSGQPLAAAHV